MKAVRSAVCLAASLWIGTALADAPPAWLAQVEPLADPATLTAPRPFKATYRIVWGGLTAARVQVDCALTPDWAEIRTVLKTSTVGFARSIWQMDAVHLAVAERAAERPIRIEETDKRDDREITSQVEFTPQGAVRTVHTVYADASPSAAPPKGKPKQFDYPNMLDVHSALLHLRNVPLANGESHVVLVMTVTNPYLVTLKALDRETVELKSGKRAAIRCSLSLGKIGKDGKLVPQAKFKSAIAWISDDADRTMLKVESKTFVGTATMELESITFNPSR